MITEQELQAAIEKLRKGRAPTQSVRITPELLEKWRSMPVKPIPAKDLPQHFCLQSGEG